jgi:PAS domain S-box-containing protein
MDAGKSETEPETGGWLLEGEPLLRALEFGEAGAWRWRIDTDMLFWSPNLCGLHGMPRSEFDGSLSAFQMDVHPDDAQPVWNAIQETLKTGRPYRAVYRSTRSTTGNEIYLEARGGIVEDGTHRYLTGVCIDVSDRIRFERDLAIRQQQAEAVASFGSFALSCARFQDTLDEAVRVAARIFNAPLTKVLAFGDGADRLELLAGVGWKDGLVGNGTVGIDSESQAGFTLNSEAPVIVHDLETETRFSGPPLLREHGVRSGMSVIIPGSSDRPFGVFGVHTTVIRDFNTQDAETLLALANIVAGAARQERALQYRQLLLREASHRAGNMLQIVGSIASQTFQDQAPPHLQSAFQARLMALARANRVIVNDGWTVTRLRDLIREVLEPFAGQLDTEGRDTVLPPELSFDLGLVLHELATNSAKYGALGNSGARVHLSWMVNPNDGVRALRIVWTDPFTRERAGHSGSGFGTQLMRDLVEIKWNGRFEQSSAGGEFRAAIEIPLNGNHPSPRD